MFTSRCNTPQQKPITAVQRATAALSQTTTTTSVYQLFSRTTWVSWHQKGKPFWILLEQEMMAWQWHQLDHMHIICTSLWTDNHASTSPISILQAGFPSCNPTNSVKALKDTPALNQRCQ